MVRIIHETARLKIAEATSDDVVLTETQDALDLMAEAGVRGARHLILHRRQIAPAFFDLKSGLAGEVLQKFSNYDVRLAVVGDLSDLTSDSLRAFVKESNRGGRLFFLNDREEAVARLAG